MIPKISDDHFKMIQEIANEIWSTYSDKHGYASEKINRVNSMINKDDNYYFIFAMFDPINQDKFIRKLFNKKQLWMAHVFIKIQTDLLNSIYNTDQGLS